MVLFIIFGTRGVTLSHESGEFACPGCGGTRQPYVHKSVRRFFTLYFIPLIPLNKVGDYYECRNCGNKYHEQVLSYDPAAQQAQARVEHAKARAEVVEHVKRMMVLTALADGDVDSAELEAIRSTYKDLSGATLSRAELDREVALAGKARIGPVDYVQRFAGALNNQGKELVIRSVHAVAAANGPPEPEEQALLNDLSAALGITPAHLRGILSELNE